MKRFTHTANIVYGTPWLIESRAFDCIAEIFQRHLDGESVPNAKAVNHFAAFGAVRAVGEPSNADAAPFYVVRENVAQIPIIGPIMPRAGMMANISSAATSCEKIGNSVSAAMANDEVNAIQLLIDSPGGSVVGGFELADRLHAASKVKPMVASIEGIGASLAYLIASQCSEIYATRASIVGSIGVIARMPVGDRMEKNMGLDVITVASSREKAMSGLSENEIRAKLEVEVQQYFGMFKDAVGRGRPGMGLEKTATGETWLASESPEGLIDGIATADEVLTLLQKSV